MKISFLLISTLVLSNHLQAKIIFDTAYLVEKENIEIDFKIQAGKNSKVIASLLDKESAFKGLYLRVEGQKSLDSSVYNRKIALELELFENGWRESKLDLDTGLYYEDTLPSISESINGSMKVLSGLDWLDSSIHLPEKLIDFCLETKPSNEGCDLVDVVYVLYRCSKETDYKKKEISKYFKIIEEIIFSHYKSDEGGFSYFINNSQEYYYGLKVTNGNNVADIHGTILLLWAISMIYDFENEENQLFNIIKP